MSTLLTGEVSIRLSALYTGLACMECTREQLPLKTLASSVH